MPNSELISVELLEAIFRIIGPVIGGLVLLLAYFAREKLRELEESDRRQEAKLNDVDQKVDDLKTELPDLYIRRTEMAGMIDSIIDRMDDIKNWMERLDRRLDTKKDKD